MSPDTNVPTQLRRDAETIFSAGIAAVDPQAAVAKHCRIEKNRFTAGGRTYDLNRFRDIFVIGAGKAAAPMARALEVMLGNRIRTGRVNVKYGHTTPLEHVEIVEAGHPVPDASGEKGSDAILRLARGSGAGDVILCVISGGGSALLPLPAQGLTLGDKQETSGVLLSCGAGIHDINAIRKHTSGIKGGRLAEAAWPAHVISLILSDVVGDDLDVIASGPTVPDSSTFKECLAIAGRYDIESRLPENVMRHLRSGAAGRSPETPKADHPAFGHTQNLIVGSNFEAIEAARKKAEALGYCTLVLSSMIEGETRHVAGVHGAIAREVARTGHPVPPPACILSGGETTVTLAGKGLGGRNQEFALAAAMDIDGAPRQIVVLSGGTDGTDGPTDAAGAVADTGTVQRAEALGLTARAYLENNDAYRFFDRLGDLLITGPTNTNVMDLRIILVT